MSTWRRRLLSLGQRLGLKSVDVGRAAVVVSRREHPSVQQLSGWGGVISVAGEPSVQQLGGAAWLVQSPGERRLRLEALDDRSWVLQPSGGRLVSQRIGPPRVRANVVHDRRAVRAHTRVFQRALGEFAGNAHVAWMLRELEVNCVLDVGANTGQYGRRLRASGYAGRIVSFEPVEEMFEKLSAAAADDPNWHVHQMALGDEDGTVEINAMHGAMSSLLPASDFGKEWSHRLQDMHPETITIRRLDAMYDEAVVGLDDPRVYLKMDTQGYDLQAFAGAGDRVKDLVGMQSEVSCVPIYDGMPRWIEQLSVYEEAGFEITGMFPVNIDRKSLRVIEFDAVLIRVEALASAAG